jgi:hypothetical protein
MRYLRPVHFLLMLPVMAALAFFAGCDGGGLTERGKPKGLQTGDVEPEPPRVAIVPTSYGTITGKITYDGTPTTPVPIPFGPNAPCCSASGKDERENSDETWRVDKNGGVQYAVVILQPTKGKFFVLPEAQQKPKESLITVEQPRCSFIPRVFVMFPSFLDPKTNTQISTEQKLKILNNAQCTHNSNVSVDLDVNSPKNPLLAPGKDEIMNLRPQEKPVAISCNLHSWMRSYGFILDHPYAAVTAEDGTFKIDNAPLDVDVQVVAWHEGVGFFNGGINGKTEKLKDKQELKLPSIKAK